MIIVDPVALGDVACTRASPKYVYDRAGTLVQVPANTLGVTYDPSDLSKAPYALIEQASTNLQPNSETFALWNIWNSVSVENSVAIAPNGTMTADAINFATVNSGVYSTLANLTPGATYTMSFFLRADIPGTITLLGATTSAGQTTVNVTTAWQRFSTTYTAGDAADGPFIARLAGNLARVYAWGGSEEPGGLSSYMSTAASAPATRAADVVTPGAGVVYSNAAIDVQTYSAATTYPKDALVYDPVAHNVFQSLIASNLGKALTDTTAWTPRGAINRWAMLDQYNNTQTSNADEILLVVSPQVIAQGLYLGNLLADEVRISVVDLVEGLVYSETQNLVISNSGSSFFNWCFKRIQRKDYFGTLKLPPYANALVTISLRKIGAIAKCGMAAIGPVDEFGPSLTGLSTEGKDYSSTTFNFDGTSNTVLRPYAKRMTCDVMADNDQIDYIQQRLFAIRQKLVIWFGGPYGSTVVAGRYESFKNVISYPEQSQMNLVIGGSV